MKIFIRILILVILAGFSVKPCFSYNDATGTTAGDFLKICGGVRAAGMGEAFVAVSDDTSAIFWNPSGLTQTKNNELSSMYTSWFQGIYLANISASMSISKDTKAGMSVAYLNMGEIKETTLAHPSGTGRTFGPYDLVATVSIAQKFSKDLSFGLSAKMINEFIAFGSSTAGMAIDYGMLYSTPIKKLTAGAAIKNIGSLGDASPLPSCARIGLAYRMLAKDALILACDLNYPNDDIMSLHAGIEYYPLDFFCLRLGVNTVSEEKAGGNLTGGIGLRLNDLGVDYAYAPYGELGEVHRVAISVSY